MGFVYNGGQPDITFARNTPRGQSFLTGLQNRARTSELAVAWPGVFGERWGTITRLVDYPHNVPVPGWAVYGPPSSRPLAPVASKNLANLTTLGLWQQLQKKG